MNAIRRLEAILKRLRPYLRPKKMGGPASTRGKWTVSDPYDAAIDKKTHRLQEAAEKERNLQLATEDSTRPPHKARPHSITALLALCTNIEETPHAAK